jgi:hypothetical protein
MFAGADAEKILRKIGHQNGSILPKMEKFRENGPILPKI